MAQSIALKLIPTVGQESDRVTIRLENLLFGQATLDEKNNILKLDGVTYQFDSLQWVLVTS